MSRVIYNSDDYIELYREITRYPERFPELQDDEGFIGDSEALDYAVETYKSILRSLFDTDELRGKTIVVGGLSPSGKLVMGIVSLDDIFNGIHDGNGFALGIKDGELFLIGIIGVSDYGYLVRVLKDTKEADEWILSRVDEVCKFVECEDNMLYHTESIVPYVRET